nr:facilitated trehalose transporter Tret1-like isoform X2 [Dermacentor andersoni]
MDATSALQSIAMNSGEAVHSRMTSNTAALAVDLQPSFNAAAPEDKDAAMVVSGTTSAAGPAPAASRPLLQSLVACWTGSVCLGTVVGYAVPAWTSLKGDPRFTNIDPFWFFSLGLLGAVGGSVVGAMSAQAIGRRRTLAVSAVGALCTWLCVGCAEQLWYLYIGRLINGFFAGMLSLVVPALIAELADARNRGAQIGRRESAMAMQRSLRKEPVEANAEFRLMERAFSRAVTPSLHYWLAAHMMFLQQFCGANIAATYARVIVAAAGIELDEGHADLAILTIQLAVACAALPLMDTVGRLRLLVASANICVVSMILLASVYPSMPADAMLYTTSKASTAANATEMAAGGSGANGSPLGLIFLAVFYFGYALGLGPLTWIQAVELTPLRGHGVELGSVCTFYWACAFCSVAFFERVRRDFGFSELGWFYGTLTLANGLVLYYFMPETKQLALETILLDECPVENMLGRRRSFYPSAVARSKRTTLSSAAGSDRLGVSLPSLALPCKSESLSADIPSPFKAHNSPGVPCQEQPFTR